MVRSLFSNWKQLVYYYYDKAMTKDTIFNIIACLYDVDYTVVAVTSDMVPGNMALWAELEIGIAPKNSFFQHPCNADLRVYVFADAPHLLKLLRNHFLDEGFNIDDRLIDKKCIQKVLAINVKDLKVAFAISQYHLDIKGSERQKVLPAAQLLSNKTACAIEWCGQKRYLENTNWKETSNFIKLCNNWFDVFNSSNIYDKHESKNAYGIDLQKQNTILYQMTDLMHKIKIGKHTKLLLFQKGIIVSNNSLQQLFIYLKEKYSDENFVI